MFKVLSHMYKSVPDPYADPQAKIPLGEVLRRDWFELWYQPKIELKTMRLVGAEALARAPSASGRGGAVLLPARGE